MYVHHEHVWTTVVAIHIDAPHLTSQQCDAARDDVVAFLHHVDEVFSTFKPESLVSQYRRGDITDAQLEARATAESPADTAARDLLAVIALCRKAVITTRGAFDPWSAPGGFDPSGLVKGWAAQHSCDILRTHGITRAYVNAGGDVYSISDGEPWTCGIADPDDRSQVVKVATIAGDGAACTSGTYERGAHIVTRDGAPLGACAASVVGPDAALADAYATAICIDGPNAIEWFVELGSAWSMFVIPSDDRLGYSYGAAWA